MGNQCPVALCHGLFGWGEHELGSIGYWGRGLKVCSSGLDLHALSVGPVSSFWDRACELIAQIKGLQVDYGEKHADTFEHDQKGRDYTNKGVYPEWCADKPLHLVGHSAGGNTIRLAQCLLAIDHYGIGSNEDWVKSITGLSAVFNGTTLSYMLGCDRETGLVKGIQGKALFKFIQLFATISGAAMDKIYDFDLDHWDYDREDGETLQSLLGKMSDSRFMKSEDNLAFDLTIQGCTKLNEVVPTYPNTYYFSEVTEQTTKYPFSDYHRPELRMNPALAAGAFYMGQFEFDIHPIAGWGTGLMEDKLWYQNDGCVSAISQQFPFTAGDHPVAAERLHADQRRPSRKANGTGTMPGAAPVTMATLCSSIGQSLARLRITRSCMSICTNAWRIWIERDSHHGV